MAVLIHVTDSKHIVMQMVLNDFLTLPTELGEISLYSMAYFTFVTISTVGYGDYAPSTVLGRTFIMIFVVGGVAFLSFATATIINLRYLEAAGKSKLKRRLGTNHPLVLICGGAVNKGNEVIVSCFLEVRFTRIIVCGYLHITLLTSSIQQSD